MENENNLILQNQKYSSMIRPYMGTSIINPFILDVVEKLGKYALIYDYRVNNPSFGEIRNIYSSNPVLLNSLTLKKTLVPENAPPVFYNFVPPISDTKALEILKREQALALTLQNFRNDTGDINQAVLTTSDNPQAVLTTSDNPQVGVFAKGNIVNVIRFEGKTAVVENPNYVVPNINEPKVSFWASLSLSGNMINQKEFKIPKEYLSKVDDNTPITESTGINFGANPKVDYIMPKPISFPYDYIDSPIKPKIIPELDNEVVLEQNANFILNKDFKYLIGYGSSIYDAKSGIGSTDNSPKYSTLKSGTKLTGRLIRKRDNTAYRIPFGGKTPPPYNDFLDVFGYSDKGRIEIPVEYLNKEVENMVNTYTRTPASVIALVDKKTGKCNQTGVIQTMDYNPCRVSAIKGQIYNGYIVGNNFSDGKDAYLTANEYQIVPQNNGKILPVKNNNKNLLMIAGAFLAGYIIFGNSKSSN